ncbi:hypothetical protein BKA69DRAFT_687810 [Paraphysoderma sedebokerense]|nr:hypothetical protein BKA69DRAFT_687810 [Paraphysoderma sedebokerense]
MVECMFSDVLVETIAGTVDAVERLDGRYSGLAYSIISPIHGTVSLADKKTLLHSTMTKLLEVASNTQFNENAKMNAMSILCILFRDSKLGKETSKFYSDSFTVIFDSFLAESANVRSAAGRLFSVILIRIFGGIKESVSSGVKAQLSPEEFFTTYHSLGERIKLELEDVASKKSSLPK